MKVNSTKLANVTYFMFFAAIIATRKGEKGSNFHDCMILWFPLLKCQTIGWHRYQWQHTNVHQKSSSFSDTKHATFTACDAVDEMGGSAREMVFDCREIFELTGFTLRQPDKQTCPETAEPRGIGAAAPHFLCKEKLVPFLWNKSALFSSTN